MIANFFLDCMPLETTSPNPHQHDTDSLPQGLGLRHTKGYQVCSLLCLRSYPHFGSHLSFGVSLQISHLISNQWMNRHNQPMRSSRRWSTSPIRARTRSMFIYQLIYIAKNKIPISYTLFFVLKKIVTHFSSCLNLLLLIYYTPNLASLDYIYIPVISLGRLSSNFPLLHSDHSKRNIPLSFSAFQLNIMNQGQSNTKLIF